MVNLVEDFPFTTLLALIGLIIGLLLPSGLTALAHYEFNQTEIVQNPANVLTGHVTLTGFALITEVISGIIGTLLMGTIGLIIDVFRNSMGGYR